MPFIKHMAFFSFVSLLVLVSATPKLVFLSFRGRETRTGFTGHLYAALDRAGIPTFIDEVGIRKGRNIYSEIERAINESIMSLILFSESYATSTDCLDEVVLIMERRRTGELLVVPIFYMVSPDEVSEQTGRYGEAFVEHEKQFKEEIHKVEEWRAALREVTDLAGMVFKYGQSEVKFIEEIVEEVQKELNDTVWNAAIRKELNNTVWNAATLIACRGFLVTILMRFLQFMVDPLLVIVGYCCWREICRRIDSLSTDSVFVNIGGRDVEAVTRRLIEVLNESGSRTGTTNVVYVVVERRDPEAFVRCPIEAINGSGSRSGTEIPISVSVE